jgi:hypothetical protein
VGLVPAESARRGGEPLVLRDGTSIVAAAEHEVGIGRECADPRLELRAVFDPPLRTGMIALRLCEIGRS